MDALGSNALGAVPLGGTGSADPLSIVVETDSALAQETFFPISFAVETDSALSITPLRTWAIGLASETDSALSATPFKHLGLTLETDTAFMLALRLGLTTETDSSLALRAIRTWAIGLATETDSVLALTLLHGETFALDIVSETDSAFAIFQRILGMAEETDEAFPILAYATDYWPFDDLQPRHIGHHKMASVIGGGTAMTGREPTISSGNGFWRIVYGGIPVNTRARILLWRSLEVKFEGRANSILIPIYDGKRAPWVTVGTPIVATANAAVAASATTIAINASSSAALQAGMFFSVGHSLHIIQAITATVGSVYTCTIWPKTREAIASGASLEFDRPLIRVRLADDNAMRLPLTHHRFGDGNITFIEDVA